MTKQRYNLKIWIIVLLIVASITPLAVLHFIATDSLDYLERGFMDLDFLLVFLPGFLFFTTVSRSWRFATYCAKDKSRIYQTQDTATFCAWIFGMIVFCGALLWLL